uniref:BICRA like chromatin remodeling complex associated protein n=1 Tax=Leptobrachium leishanense TaxID=445787 RepID=A0A8C5W938_9ANUR
MDFVTINNLVFFIERGNVVELRVWNPHQPWQLYGDPACDYIKHIKSHDKSRPITFIFQHADSKSSLKGAHNQVGEGAGDGLQLSNSFQFLEDELESSAMPDLNEDILQKSLDEANITEQILAEEAYLDASVGSSQQFSNVSLHSHTSASFTQATNVHNYSGQSLHSIGMTHVPVVQQQVGASFASNTVDVQHGYMQHVGIIPNQHMPNSNHGGSGQIHVISSVNNQSPMMTINNIDGSHIILKSGQQASANASAGLMVHRQMPNGNAMYGNPNASSVGQPVAVPFNSGNFHTSLPVHNIIIHRGSTPNTNKAHINIQPKPVQIGQQTTYNVHQIGIQQHNVNQGVPFTPGNSPQGSVGQQMTVHQPGIRNQVGHQPGSSIVIHSSAGQQPSHPNQFVIPTGVSVNSGSVQHIQTINNPLVQPHLTSHQLPSDHVMINRNATSMVRHAQPYSGQMLNSHGASVQLVPGQTFTGPSGPVILNHGQMSQVSPSVLHLSPGQGNAAQARSNYPSAPHSVSNVSAPSRFTVVSSGTVLQNVGPTYQNSAGDDQFAGDQQQNRIHSAISESSSNPTNSFFSPHLFFSPSVQVQMNVMNHQSPVPSLKAQDTLRQSHLGTLSKPFFFFFHLNDCVLLLIALLFSYDQVDGKPGSLKRPASRQLTKETLILQQLCKDEEHCVLPDKSQFSSLNDAVQRLLPYHVFQGSLPSEEEIQKVDNEFEAVATHLLKKTQAMLNKYRLLLLEDAMRINPSAEVVMLDRIFNQEERSTLTREKRMSLIDPDGFLTEFCCASKYQEELLEGKESDDQTTETIQSSPNPCEISNIPKGNTDLTVPRSDGKSGTVPDINAASSDKVDLGKDVQKKASSCPVKKQQSNICRTKLEGIKEPMESKKVLAEAKSLQEKTPWPSPETGSKSKDDPGSPVKHFKGSKESLKETVKNALEQKISGRNLQREISGGSSAKRSPGTTEETCGGNAISDSRAGTVETDSVLEAAVNSILEC